VDLFDVVRACFRRWYVVLPVLFAAVWYAHGAYASVKPVYYTSAVVGMAPSSQISYTESGAPTSRNGLLDAGGPTLIANMAVLAMREPAVVSQVVAAGGRPDYGVKMFPVPATMPELPLIMIDAGERTPESATKTVELVAAQVDAALRSVQQQAAVPDDQMVRAFPVSSPGEPVQAMPSRTQSAILIIAAGAGAAVLIGVVLDVLLMRWKVRRQNRRQAKSQDVNAAHSNDANGADPPDDTRKVPFNADAAEDVPLGSP
jgi:hypothetical protein